MKSKLMRYKGAMGAFKKALKINPNLARAWANIGLALYNLGRYKESITAFEKAIKINPRLVEAHSNLGELLFNLGNLKGASKEVKKALDINLKYAEAWILRGRIKIEEQLYDSAAESFEKAIALDLGNPLLLLWHAYAQYLEAEFSSDTSLKRYREKIHSIIRELDRVEKLSKKHGKKIRAYILYFLGYFYYKSKDMFTAKEKLEECIRLKSSIKSSARELLRNIWNYQIRPPWWRWWLTSPLHRWGKRIVFVILSLFILGLFGLHSFIPEWIYPLKINFTLYMFFIVLLLIIFFSPSIERIKAKDIEIEMRHPPPFEFVLSPAIMEEKIAKLETHLER